MLKLEMLPASCGDCLWLEYGTPPETKIIIIDGGLAKTTDILRARIEAACEERNKNSLNIELVVVTHIDNDHIVGIIDLLEKPTSLFNVKDIWFNGRPQLRNLPSSPKDLLGPNQGDELSKLLETRDLPWNKHALWKGDAVMLPDSGKLPVITLGDLTLTLLGPTLECLKKLYNVWPNIRDGEDPVNKPKDLLGRRDEWPPEWEEGEKMDTRAANGSSISLLAEYGEHTLLLAGDAHAPDLLSAIERLAKERGLENTPYPLSAFKLPHHGSAKNLTRALLEKIDCTRFLISTDGSNHRHPDHQALLRILRYSKKKPEIMFNYKKPTTLPWSVSKADVLAAGFRNYDTAYPKNQKDGLILELSSSG